MVLETVDAAVHTQRQAITGPIDIFDHLLKFIRIETDHVQYRTKHFTFELADMVDLKRDRCMKAA